MIPIQLRLLRYRPTDGFGKEAHTLYQLLLWYVHSLLPYEATALGLLQLYTFHRLEFAEL
jgi:hypothetical protein